MKDKSTKSRVENKALSQVNENERQSWTSIAFIWVGTMICIPMLMVGGIFASALTFSNIFIATVIGFAICCLIMVLGGMQGHDLGIPSTMCATRAFGSTGSSFTMALAIFIGDVGWFAIQTATCAVAFNTLMELVNTNVPFAVSCLIWGCVMTVTAVYGFGLMKWLNYIACPLLIALCVYGAVHSVNQSSWQAITTFTAENTMSMSIAVSTVIGLFAVGACCNADYTRYAKSRGDVVKATVLGVLPAAVLMIMVGSIMALGTGNYDVTSIFANLGMPVVAMLVLILATWTTNTGNAYASGLASMKLFRLRDELRPIATLGCGVLGTVLAMLGIANAMESYISIVSALVPPVAGVVIADYWIVCKGNPENWKPVKGVNWIGIIAWILGALVALFFSFFSTAVDSIVVSMVSYLVLNTVLGKTGLRGKGEITIEEATEVTK
ncbi:MAG: cytosine permease, partial [Anaerotignum sp.]|nr:cytosine permease [Anaerotignum sp.]